jgi:hypothetical protein
MTILTRAKNMPAKILPVPLPLDIRLSADNLDNPSKINKAATIKKMVHHLLFEFCRTGAG